MIMKRTIPPAAAPINIKNLLQGFSGLFLNKEYLRKLDKELKDYFQVKHVFLVSSGKAALTLILCALQSLSPGRRRVLIPAYTCFSVPSAIVKAGLEVALCDIDASTLDFNHERFDRSMNESILCAIPSHLFGIPSDMDKIKRMCRNKDIFIVEDAAQAMGGKYNGKLLGTIGDVGFFSLGRGKNITCGSGGIIVTNDDRIAAAIDKRYSKLEQPRFNETLAEYFKALLLAVFIRPALYWFPAGLPFLRLGETTFEKEFPIKKISGMKAGLLRNWRQRLEKSNRIRKDNAKYICNALGLNLWNNSPVPFLRLPLLVKNGEARDKIVLLARQQGLGINRMYPTAINEIEELKDQFSGMMFPSAREIAERLVSLPTHHLLSMKDKEKICGYLTDQWPVIIDQPLAFKRSSYAR
jgi:perosamine synthetase